jgi:acetolactate synthase regulatory subunit
MYVILRLLRRRGFAISGIQEHQAALEPEVPLKVIRRARRSSFLFSLEPAVDPGCFRIAFTERVEATRRTKVESS